MPIFWIKSLAKNHLSLLALLGAFCVLFPKSGFSLEMSTPIGRQQIGQRLDLKSTLSNIPEGAESQLRSTCLKAKFYTLESTTPSHEFAAGQEVLVNFDPTIRRGGLLELKSVMPVNSALIEIELVSECPLLVFKTRWALIMNQSEEKAAEVTNPNIVKRASVFDPKGSKLLADSRKPPPKAAVTTSKWMVGGTQTKRESEQAQQKVAQAVIDATTIKISPAVPSIASSIAPSHAPPIDASLGSDLVRAGLIESSSDTQDLLESQSGHNKPAPVDEHVSSNNYTNWITLIALGAAALLTLALFAYRKYALEKSVSNSGTADGEPNANNLLTKSREHAMTFSAEPATAGSHRVLESLLGGDEQDLNEYSDVAVHATNLNVNDHVQRSSLTISLELINRADIPSWKLPAAYLNLVESRNRALELHRTPAALLLRAHIGLVELAFQDAKQGMSTRDQASTELLDQVLGEQLFELEATPALYVPDVVKSHVRAKMCEISGAEKRQLLRENLVNLNTQVLSSALCFGSNAWREFLSEEGILE